MLTGESKYEGEFRDDQRHGQGVMRFEDGSVYEGNFKVSLVLICVRACMRASVDD